MECPNCGVMVDGPKNRMAKEACGHMKCRQCFLDEESGCRQCENDNIEYVPDEIVEEPLNSDHRDRQKTVITASSKVKSEWTKQSGNTLPFEILYQEEEEPQDDEAESVEELNEIPRNCVIILNKSVQKPQRNRTKKRLTKKALNQGSTTVIPKHLQLLDSGEAGITQYKCLICDKLLKHTNTVQYHIYCDPQIPKPFACDHCPMTFRTSEHLKYHTGTHFRDEHKQSCSFCGKSFQNKLTLQVHERQNHSATEAPFKCHQCGEKFFYKSKFQLHQALHNKSLPHVCNKCPKAFRLKENLQKHMAVHSDLKPFTCDECGTTFKRKEAWKQHIKKHNKGYKPEFGPCEHCGRKFNHLTALKRHRLVHTTGEAAKFTCSLCGIKCKRKDNLDRHIRVMHSTAENDLQEIEDAVVDNGSDAPTVKADEPPASNSNRQDSVIIFVGPQQGSTKSAEPIAKRSNEATVVRSIDPRPSSYSFPQMSSGHLELYRKILLPSKDDDVASIVDGPTAVDNDNMSGKEFVHWRKRTRSRTRNESNYTD